MLIYENAGIYSSKHADLVQDSLEIVMSIRIFLGVGFRFIHHAADTMSSPVKPFELPSCPKYFESRLLFIYILAVSRCHLQKKLETRSSFHNEHKETYSAQTKLLIKVTSWLRGRVSYWLEFVLKYSFRCSCRSSWR